MQSEKQIRNIQKHLSAWYKSQKRDLPWRRTSDPYKIWVSEIMLQQTQVNTVIPYYQRWVSEFPTVRKLASAPEKKVLKLWEGLGYYSRARNLRKAAQVIIKNYQGKVPDTQKEIMRLPGVGRYSAGAILSIAYDQKTPVLDGNVKRILSRWFCMKENGSSSASEKRLWQTAEKILPAKNPGDFNQSLMELGATVCLPKNPLCMTCPVSGACEANVKGKQHLFPPAKPKTTTKKIEVSAAVILRKGKTYIQQRPHDGLMGGLWEFPGGKREKNESTESCLLREIREELGVNVVIKEKLMTIKHSYTQFRVTLHVFHCNLPSGKIRATECEKWKWVLPEDLRSYPFPAANVKIVNFLTNGWVKDPRR